MFKGRREHAAIGTTLLVALGLGPSACVKDYPLDTQTDRNASEVKTTDGPLIPLAEGNSWTYSVTKEGKTSTKVLKVEAEEEVGGDGASRGETAFKISTTKDDKPDAVSWEALAGKRFVRYREQELSGKSGDVKAETSWDPPRLVVDAASAHVATGASWAEAYAETVVEDEKEETSDEKDTWSVDAVDEVVTVPAGTFKALVLRRQGGSKAKTFWYVKGVGKVKEDGDELEELLEYELGKGDGARDSDTDEASDADEADAEPDADDDAEPTPDGDDDAEPEADPDADDDAEREGDGAGGADAGTLRDGEVAP